MKDILRSLVRKLSFDRSRFDFMDRRAGRTPPTLRGEPPFDADIKVLLCRQSLPIIISYS